MTEDIHLLDTLLVPRDREIKSNMQKKSPAQRAGLLKLFKKCILIN